MPILRPQDRNAVRTRFDTELKRSVNVTLVTQKPTPLYIPGRDCRSCGPTQELLEELAALSPMIDLEVLDFYGSRQEAVSRGVDKIPAILIGAGGSQNARLYGLPSGLEFSVLLDSIVERSRKRGPLQLETRRRLKRLTADVHIQVFVTPDCRFCPGVARVAHQMAMESPRVVADVVEIREFPSLAQRYRVMGVPKTVINDTVQFTGAVTEAVLLEMVLKATGAAEASEDVEETVSEQTTPI